MIGLSSNLVDRRDSFRAGARPAFDLVAGASPRLSHETPETEALEDFIMEKVFRQATRIYNLLRDIDAPWASEQVEILIALRTK